MGRKRQFVLQALLMTAVSLLLRTVGVSAQVYIAGEIGSEAVGVSSLIGGVGGFALTLAFSGIQLGTTRLVAEGLGKENPALIRRTLRCTFLYALFFGCLSGVLLFSFAPLIGEVWLRDLRTVPSLRVMALTLPVTSVGGCIVGYFIAVRRVYLSAAIQVAEEIVRLFATVFLLRRMAGSGVESALLALAVSGAVADVFSGIFLFLLYRLDRRRHAPPLSSADLASAPPLAAVNRRLLSITLPVAVSAYARSGLLTLEHLLIPVGLRRFGLTNARALSAYGALHSMALPVVLFPSALLASFSGLLIPELTESAVRREDARVERLMTRTFSLTLFFAIGCAGTMLCFSEELGDVLYRNAEVAGYIRRLSPLIPVMYLDSAVDAMLKGLGEQLYSMKINIADAALSVLLVCLLVPKLGIDGYIVTIYVSEIFNAALSVTRLLNVSALRPRVLSWVGKPLLGVIAATALSRLLFTCLARAGLSFPSKPALTLTLHIVVTALLYALSLLLTGALHRTDLRWLKTAWTD